MRRGCESFRCRLGFASSCARFGLGRFRWESRLRRARCWCRYHPIRPSSTVHVNSCMYESCLVVTYVPSRRSIVGLGGVVVSLTVSSEEKDLVLHIIRRLAIQALDFLVKSLPLGFAECFAFARISAID